MILSSDGYEYEDLTQRLLGIRAQSPRNFHIEFSTFDYKNDPQAQKAFIKGYDDWKVRLNPLYWFESGVERGWLRAGKGHEAVVRYWAGCKP